MTAGVLAPVPKDTALSKPLVQAAGPSRWSKPLVNVCFLRAVLHAAFFAALYGRGWIFDDSSLNLPTDFVNVWSAGRLALEVRALAGRFALAKRN